MFSHSRVKCNRPQPESNTQLVRQGRFRPLKCNRPQPESNTQPSSESSTDFFKCNRPQPESNTQLPNRCGLVLQSVTDLSPSPIRNQRMFDEYHATSVTDLSRVQYATCYPTYSFNAGV